MQSKQPALMVSLAASEDAAWLARWERHLLPLQQTGHLLLWSERLILGGEDRSQQMNRQVDRADLIVFLLSADFFASQDCMDLMERALARQQTQSSTLIPLLLRPVQWQESSLGFLSYLPSNGRPIMNWGNADEAFYACATSIRQLLGLPRTEVSKPQQIPLPLKQRLQVIHMLQQDYRQRLDHLLQGQAAIELGLHARTSSKRLVFHDTEAEQPLPEGTTIIQVYDRAQLGLLLLGAPGAGKTTLLLDLALELLQRAENNAEHPLPIILSLSLWGMTRLTFIDWLCEQLYLVYGITRKVGASWIEQDQILFLLDGLNEVKATARSACVAALNQFRAEHFVTLIVASRSREYEQQQAPLILPTAVEIQPLEPKEVMTYLAQAGPALAMVRTVVQTHPTLQQLLTTPLMLMMVLLTYRDQEIPMIPPRGSLKEQQRQIFAQYVQHMVKRYQYRRNFSLAQTFSSLIWLAQQMQQRQLTEFHLEMLQMDWLSTKRAQSIYRRLFFGFRRPHDIQLVERIVWSWEKSKKGLIVGLTFGFGGLAVGEACGLVIWLVKGLVIGLLLGPVIGLVIGLFMLLNGLLNGLSGISLGKNMRLKPNQGILASGWNGFRLGFFCFLYFVLLGTLLGNLASGLVMGLLSWLSGGMVYGGLAWFQHYVLRLFLAPNLAWPWRTVPFLEEATDCILLQRVGGGYRFIHPLLQEYFAGLGVEAILEQDTEQTQSPT